MNSGIYQIVNKVNNKRYIGSSINIKQRWSAHKSELRNNKHSNKHLQAAWNYYGEAAFKFELMWSVEPVKEVLLYEEQLALNNLICEYNICTSVCFFNGQENLASIRLVGKKYSFNTKKNKWQVWYFRRNDLVCKDFKTEQEAIDFIKGRN